LVIGCLRKAGFTIAMAAHAFSALDSYIYGFAMQELNLPFDNTKELEQLAGEILRQLPADQFPYFTEMVVEHALKPGYAYAKEFEFGLDLMLDALERIPKAAGGAALLSGRSPRRARRGESVP
jgi:hypothetical protein